MSITVPSEESGTPRDRNHGPFERSGGPRDPDPAPSELPEDGGISITGPSGLLDTPGISITVRPEGRRTPVTAITASLEGVEGGVIFIPDLSNHPKQAGFRSRGVRDHPEGAELPQNEVYWGRFEAARSGGRHVGVRFKPFFYRSTSNVLFNPEGIEIIQPSG